MSELHGVSDPEWLRAFADEHTMGLFAHRLKRAADRIEELEGALRLISEMGIEAGNHPQRIAKKALTPAS